MNQELDKNYPVITAKILDERYCKESIPIKIDEQKIYGALPAIENLQNHISIIHRAYLEYLKEETDMSDMGFTFDEEYVKEKVQEKIIKMSDEQG